MAVCLATSTFLAPNFLKIDSTAATVAPFVLEHEAKEAVTSPLPPVSSSLQPAAAAVPQETLFDCCSTPVVVEDDEDPTPKLRMGDMKFDPFVVLKRQKEIKKSLLISMLKKLSMFWNMRVDRLIITK